MQPHGVQTLKAGRRFLLILSASSGVLLGVSFPPIPLGVLAFFGIVPLFILADYVEGYLPTLRYAYVGFLVFNAITLYWTGGFVHGNDLWMMIGGMALVLVHPLFFLVPIWVYLVVRNHLGVHRALLLFPFLWVAFEYLHSLGQPAFPWLTLGNTQTYDLAQIQFITATGVYGVSFLIVTINVSAYYLYRKMAFREWPLVSPRSLVAGFVIVALYSAPKLYGSLLMKNEQRRLADRSLNVGLVQTNADPWEKWRDTRESQLKLHLQLSRELVSHEPDLVIWPETAMPFYLLHTRSERDFSRVRSFVDSTRVAVLTGTPLIQYYEDAESAPPGSRKLQGADMYFETFNGAVLIRPMAHELQTYAKMLLVPFAERVPYSEHFSFLNLLEWDAGLGGWARGRDSTVFSLGRLSSSEGRKPVRFATLICYESIYPGYTASYVRKGAEFLVIITIDSWWGRTSGAYQHLQLGRLRAIENRRWIARSAAGGISCFIDPYGRIIDQTGLFAQSTLVREIGLSTEQTFYTRHGDLFAKGCTVLTALGVVATAMVGLRNRLRGRN
ncbi:MAG: apolipoprotein N-acyltransferase [Bacteroidota bacterium]